MVNDDNDNNLGVVAELEKLTRLMEANKWDEYFKQVRLFLLPDEVRNKLGK